MRRPLDGSIFGFAFLIDSARSLNLPYNPARILYSRQQTGNYAYLLQPGADSTKAADFSSIDLSVAQDASNLSLNRLSSNLPFLTSSSTAYTTVVGPSGNITVLAGDCTAGADGSQVWRFEPDAQAQNGNGSWAKDIVTPTLSSSQSTSDALAGSNFLSSGLAFSQHPNALDSSTSLFYFGGMCLEGSNAAASTAPADWASAADYSALMITMLPEASDDDNVDYQLSLVASNGPPIAEAGFSITPLLPSYLNSSDGTQTQQQDFVLLGGHTQNAFINMSQVALFSLPQALWSFLPIDQFSSLASAKRAASKSDVVTPRSGHTAVLTEDGTSIIVFGGWVGNVSTPATPQLAIVELGLGFGGQGDWRWVVPAQDGAPGLASSKGLYGHGAAMLPGNVMMVMGGYPIDGSSSAINKRTSQGTSNQAFFYNVSSNAWLSSYSSSSAQSSATQKTQTTTGSLSSTSQKAGLAIGLVLGIILVVGLIVLGLWYRRRTRHNREARDSLLRSLVSEKDQQVLSSICPSDPPPHYPDHDPYQDSSSAKGHFPWLPNVDSSGRDTGTDADCTGAYRDIPSPTRGLRKTSGSRIFANQTPSVPEERRGIHMIEERDEDGSLRSRPSAAAAQPQPHPRAIGDVFGPQIQRPRTAASDPFKDPESPFRSNPASPEVDSRSITCVSPSKFGHNSVTVHKDQIVNWVTEWSAPHEMHSSNGRRSPSKYSDRTGSNLSEQSHYSTFSSKSLPRPFTSRTHHPPWGVSSASTSPVEDRAFSFGRKGSPEQLSRTRSITGPVLHAARQISPKRSFAKLRSEGAALLGGSAAAAGFEIKRPPSSVYSQDRDAREVTSSGPAKTQPKKNGWMGSFRRVFGTVSDRSVSASEPMTPNGGVERSFTTSPVKSAASTPHKRLPPRRTASESSAFLRMRQGKRDWNSAAERETAWEPYDDTPDMGDWGCPDPPSPPPPVPSHRLLLQRKAVGAAGNRQPPLPPPPLNAREEDEDWDVEQAAAGRDFQVMFTVPKARLRVVNADVDRLSQRSVSDENGRSVVAVGKAVLQHSPVLTREMSKE